MGGGFPQHFALLSVIALNIFCCGLCYWPISTLGLWGLQGQRPYNFMSLFLVPSTVLGTEVDICWLKRVVMGWTLESIPGGGSSKPRWDTGKTGFM